MSEPGSADESPSRAQQPLESLAAAATADAPAATPNGTVTAPAANNNAQRASSNEGEQEAASPNGERAAAGQARIPANGAAEPTSAVAAAGSNGRPHPSAHQNGVSGKSPRGEESPDPAGSSKDGLMAPVTIHMDDEAIRPLSPLSPAAEGKQAEAKQQEAKEAMPVIAEPGEIDRPDSPEESPDAVALDVADEAGMTRKQREDAAARKRMEELRGSLELGLTAAEAKERLEKYGPNELREAQKNALLEFLKSFWGPLPWAIEVAAILSAVTQSWIDFGIITFLLVANAIIGFVQERNAGNAIAELKKNMPHHARVIRDGAWQAIGVADIVPGDVVAVKLGDMIPADGCIITIDSETPLQVDQSSLTGESKTVKKALGDRVLSSSLIKEGEAEMVALHTGTDTFIGRAAELVRSSAPSGHFQRILTRLANFMILSALLCVAAILIAAGVRNDGDWLETIRFCMVLLVVSVPIALPTVLSVTMAVGAHYLSNRNAVCSRLTAVEELSAVDILCCDKTGTLTKNELSVEIPVPFQRHTADDAILFGVLASNVNNPDAIDTCLVRCLQEKPDALRAMADYKQMQLKPFNPIWKRMEATVYNKTTSQTLMVSKGAPQAIFKLLTPAAQTRLNKKWQGTIDMFARRGMRALGVAKKIITVGDGARNDEELRKQDAPKPRSVRNDAVDNANGGADTEVGEWMLVGLIPLFDPPRDDSQKVIQLLQDLGVQVKMLTGDQVQIAVDTSQRLGLGTNILNCEVLDPVKQVPSPTLASQQRQNLAQSVWTLHQGGDGRREVTHDLKRQASRLPPDHEGEEEEHVKGDSGSALGRKKKRKGAKPPLEESLMRLVESVDGFGEVMPQHKHQVVRVLQYLGHTVGMTGDGVNDAPALKVANVGIAVSGATDAARGAADVILMSPGLSVIADAIVESRRIFSRMQAYATYRIAVTVTELTFFTLAALIWNFFLQPLALVYIAIWNDFTVITVAMDRATYKKVPVSWDMKILLSKGALLGIYLTGCSFVFYYLAAYYYNLPEETVQTLLFLQVSTGSQLTIFSCRVENSGFVTHAPSPWMVLAVLSSQLLSAFIAAYGLGLHPMGWMHVLQVWMYCFIQLLGFDTLKELLHLLIVGDEEAKVQEKREQVLLQAPPQKLAADKAQYVEQSQRSLQHRASMDHSRVSLRRLDSMSRVLQDDGKAAQLAHHGSFSQAPPDTPMLMAAPAPAISPLASSPVARSAPVPLATATGSMAPLELDAMEKGNRR